MCQHELDKTREVLKFQMISAKHFNVKNQIKSMFKTICNMYCIIKCKNQIICYLLYKFAITYYRVVAYVIEM